jgi:hypothetical protein
MPFFGNKRRDFSIQPPRQQVDGTPFFVTDSANIDFTLDNLNLTADLTFTGVTAGTYGDATNIPVLQIDQWGRVTGVTTIPIGGGGGTYTVDNGLSPQTIPSSNPNNFQLGGTLIKPTVITAQQINANNSLRFDAPSNLLNSLGAFQFTAINTTTYTPTARLASFRANDCIAAYFETDIVFGSSSTAIKIKSLDVNSIPLLIENSAISEILKVNDSGQLSLSEYNTATAFQGSSGTSVGVLNVDNTGKVFVGSGGGGGGGGGRSYYLNGSVIQGNFAGILDMRQMSPVPVIGTGTDFTINTNGYIKSFITDAGDPNKAVIPAGNWNFELWFSVNNTGGSPSFYVELSKYDGAAFTLIATGSANPTNITTTATTLYITALGVPQTPLLLTDRLAVRVFVNHGGGGRVVTLHTQGPHLSQIITDFPSGITSLNGLTAFVQNFATPGTTGTAPNWSSALDTHTLNIPLASVASVTAGLISKTEYDTFNGKQDALTLTTTGTSGAATLIGATLNIPQYSGGGPGGDSIASLSNSSGDVSAAASAPSQLNVVATLKANLKTGSFGVTVDGVTAVVQVGQIGYVVMPYDGTITKWTITSNVSGSISFDIWRDTLIDTIPTIGDSIVGGVYPSITGTNFGTSTSLGSWTSTTFLAGHIFGFYVNSASTIKNATLTLRTTKS